MAKSLAGKLADPQWRHNRAVNAGKARTTVDHHVAAIVRNKDSLTEQQRAEIRGAVGGWPALSEDLKAELAVLLQAGDGDAS